MGAVSVERALLQEEIQPELAFPFRVIYRFPFCVFFFFLFWCFFRTSQRAPPRAPARAYLNFFESSHSERPRRPLSLGIFLFDVFFRTYPLDPPPRPRPPSILPPPICAFLLFLRNLSTRPRPPFLAFRCVFKASHCDPRSPFSMLLMFFQDL